MPLSPKEMALRSREEYRQARMEKLKNDIITMKSHTNLMKPRKNSKMEELIKEIYSHFQKLPPRVRTIAAKEFEYLTEAYAPKTRVIARQKLGITSQRRNGQWYWKFPTRSPSEALDKAHQQMLEEIELLKEEEDKCERQSSKTLRELMTDSHMFALRDDIIAEMSNRGYSRSTIMKMKMANGIATKKLDGITYWVWGNYEVQHWLEAYLGDHEVPLQQVFDDAMTEKGWHAEVIKMAKHGVGGIRYKMLPVNGVSRIHWFNFNDTPRKESEIEEPKPIPVSIEKRKDYTLKNYIPSHHQVEVNFGEGTDTGDWFEEESHVSMSDEIVLPSGVKIGVFK